MSIKKTVIINRAVPGSGKTTITNSIYNTLKEYNLEVLIHSTDKYFMVGDRYVFHLDKLDTFHQENLKSFEKSLKNNHFVVICDNTNLTPWQTEPYTKLAREYGYQIIFITFDPREIKKHVESQIITLEKPDAHGVSEEIILRMIDEYHLYDSLLFKKNKIDTLKQIEYRWNEETLSKEPTGKPSEYFDVDYVIRILPSEYHKIKHNIGIKIMELINER